MHRSVNLWITPGWRRDGEYPRPRKVTQEMDEWQYRASTPQHNFHVEIIIAVAELYNMNTQYSYTSCSILELQFTCIIVVLKGSMYSLVYFRSVSCKCPEGQFREEPSDCVVAK